MREQQGLKPNTPAGAGPALAARRTGASADRGHGAGLRASRLLLLVFALLAACIVGAGALYGRYQEQQNRMQIEREFSAVAELKTAGVTQWRRERLADAEFISRHSPLIALIRRALVDVQDRQLRERVLAQLQELRQVYGYDHVHLVDTRGVPLLAFPQELALPAQVTRHAGAVLGAAEVGFKDFHRDGPGGAIHLSLLVPIAGEARGGEPVGLLYLAIDPRRYLYPFIQRWPTPSESGETLLVRREGEELVFLNQLRFRDNAALALRSPLTNLELPAVQAVLGQQGMVEGVDYRGVPVIASVRAVPGTPWFLIAKMDRAEALAPLRRTLWLLTGLVAALLLAAAAGAYILSRRQRLRSSEARAEVAETQAAAAARYGALFDSVNDAIVACRADGNIAEWNPAATRMFGYSQAEALGQPLTLLMPQRFRDAHEAGMRRVLAGGERQAIGKTVELAGLSKTGSEFPLELSLSHWASAEGPFFVGIMHDITGRLRVEAANMRQLDELRRWQAVMLEREDRNMELKREVNALLRRQGEPVRYPSQEGEGET